MKTKTFLVAGIVGGIVIWLLSWFSYSILFSEFFPQPKESTKTTICVLLTCLTFGLFLSYLYNRWAQISTAATGARAGAFIGLFLSIIYNFNKMVSQQEMTSEMFATDLGITIVLTSVAGAVVGAINGKLI